MNKPSPCPLTPSMAVGLLTAMRDWPAAGGNPLVRDALLVIARPLLSEADLAEYLSRAPVAGAAT